jgi:hypothetical protein
MSTDVTNVFIFQINYFVLIVSYKITMTSTSMISSVNKSRTPDVKPIRLQLDPIRLHEPARTKLSTIESQRIMVVFDDLVQKMELIEILPIIVSRIDLFQSVIDT